MTFELILFCSIFGLMIMAAYSVGLRNGQRLSRKEEITVPNLNPVNAINKHIEIKEEEKEQKELLEYLNAIENYDGRM